MTSQLPWTATRKHWWIALIVPASIALIVAAASGYIALHNSSEDRNLAIAGNPASCAQEQKGSNWGWGPERPLVGPGEYDFAKQTTFNVDYANPNYGDERNFLVAKEGTYTEAGQWADELQVRPGSEYVVRAYIHNGASDAPEFTAKNTRFTLDLPSCVGTTINLVGVISASNAAPAHVWDGVVLRSPLPFRLEFVPGSARLLNDTNRGPGILLPDRIGTSDGALIGSVSADGLFGGNYINSAVVTFRIRALEP